MDNFKFEMQDIKNKTMFTYDIIVKIELSETNRQYFSLNAEKIEFGYCGLLHFKEDSLVIKNYSTDKVVVNIDSTGDNDLQTVDNMTINLFPNQTFTIPIFAYVHGLGIKTSELVLNFNNGNYVKKIPMSVLGIDFAAPLISIKNEIGDYYRKMLDELGVPKYI